MFTFCQTEEDQKYRKSDSNRSPRAQLTSFQDSSFENKADKSLSNNFSLKKYQSGETK